MFGKLVHCIVVLLCCGGSVTAAPPDNSIQPSPPSATDAGLPAPLTSTEITPAQSTSALDATFAPQDLATMAPSWQLTPIPGTIPPTSTATDPGWYVTADAMFLHLNQGRNQGLVYDLINLAPVGPPAIVRYGPVVSTNDVSNNVFEAVPRLTLGYRDTDGSSIEATYFGRNDWAGSTAIASNPAYHPPIIYLQTPDTFVADRITTSLSSTVHSFEVNVFEPTLMASQFEFLGGLRFFRLTDQFQLQSHAVINSNFDQSRYSVQTTNDLYGVQLGVRWKQAFNRFSIVAIGKTGIYANDAAAQQQLAYSYNASPVIVRDQTASRPTFSTIQEVGLNGTYQLAGYCTIRAGYNLFVVTGAARATDQIDFSSNPFPSLNSHGTAVLHGPSAGIEFRF